MNIIDKILTPFDNLWRSIKNFFYRLQRSSRWFIRTWNNYDWEHDYLIQMMVNKMEDMRYQFDVRDKKFVNLRHQPVHFDETSEFEDDLKGLDEAIEIGKRIIKNDYVEYPPEVENWFETHSIIDGDYMSISLKKKWKKCHEIADKKERDDRKKFFDIIRDEHQKWWS